MNSAVQTQSQANKRRQLLTAGGGLLVTLMTCPTAAAVPDLASALATYTEGQKIQPGKVQLDVPALVDNGNSVALTVTLDSPMTAADHVKSIAIFNERNPQREVARFYFMPGSGKAWAATRIRLATSQKLIAVAQLSDGSYWSHTVDVLVTLAACIEGDV
ncbi:MAG: SoxY-related AACIE arm protein [Burkholderiales bacterium]